jgi:hypothetical protein
MALKNVFCLELPNPPPVPRLEIPQFGPLEVAKQSILDFPDPSYFIMRMLDAAAVALAPLRRYLEMIEVVFALKQCMEAVKDALLPPSPKPIIDCLKDLLEKIQRILALFPPLSYIQTALDISDIAVQLVDEILAIFYFLDEKVTAYKALINAGIDLGDLELAQIGDCASSDTKAITLNMLGPVKLTLPLFRSILQPLTRFIPNEQLKKYVEDLADLSKAFDQAESTILAQEGPPVIERLMTPLAQLRNLSASTYNILAPVIGKPANMPLVPLPEFDNF